MQAEHQNNLETLWNQALAHLRTSLDHEEFENWIRPLTPVQAGSGTLEISVPNRLFAAWIEENYLEALAKAWVETSGRKTRFTFTWDSNAMQGELFKNLNDSRPRKLEAAPPIARSGLIDRYDFNSFVVGPGNQFAHAAAMAIAKKPGSLYNPFFIYGGVGLGKTHLVNAIGNAVLAADPDKKVVFISADTFTNQLIEAIARNKAPAFKTRMRRIDILIIDDVQFLAGRDRTQEEFFHIFNALSDNNRQIVLTSDKFPSELKGVEERLCNRFGSGLVADIQAPDYETRIAILERKARDERIELPMEVAAFIAQVIETNIRDLEGALTRISAFSSLNDRPVTLDLAREMLASVSGESARVITLDEIEDGVTVHFGLKPGELSARRRTKKVAEARQIAMYIMRNHSGASYPVIGRQLGGRDHSTVIHAVQTVDKRRREDPRFRRMLETVTKSLGCC
ncbi:MAG: chromosomal replication initiator protein [Hyphomicrobiaceae bacterium]